MSHTPSPAFRRAGRPVNHQLGGKTVKGLGLLGKKRQRKVMKDTIFGITKGDIRRLARRGGVKRMATPIYEDARDALKSHLKQILEDCVAITDHCKRKTVTVHDVIFTLKRMGRPIYGFGNMNEIKGRD